METMLTNGAKKWTFGRWTRRSVWEGYKVSRNFLSYASLSNVCWARTETNWSQRRMTISAGWVEWFTKTYKRATCGGRELTGPRLKNFLKPYWTTDIGCGWHSSYRNIFTRQSLCYVKLILYDNQIQQFEVGHSPRRLFISYCLKLTPAKFFPRAIIKQEHWMPYWELCFPCDIHYDYILKLETIKVLLL